jgi:hypothetical protein
LTNHPLVIGVPYLDMGGNDISYFGWSKIWQIQSVGVHILLGHGRGQHLFSQTMLVGDQKSGRSCCWVINNLADLVGGWSKIWQILFGRWSKIWQILLVGDQKFCSSCWWVIKSGRFCWEVIKNLADRIFVC